MCSCAIPAVRRADWPLRAGVESVRSLADASEQIARGLPLAGGLYAVDTDVGGECELRVIATGPQLASPGDPKGLGALLAMARGDGAHALTVIDCGTLQRAADRFALRRASHVAWVLPATDDGLRQAERLLARIRPAGHRTELVVARHVPHTKRGGLRRLRTLADTRNAPLVLMPHADDLGRAQVGLQAILGVLKHATVTDPSMARAASQTFGACTSGFACFQNRTSQSSRLYHPLPTMPCRSGYVPVR